MDLVVYSAWGSSLCRNAVLTPSRWRCRTASWWRRRSWSRWRPSSGRATLSIPFICHLVSVRCSTHPARKSSVRRVQPQSLSSAYVLDLPTIFSSLALVQLNDHQTWHRSTNKCLPPPPSTAGVIHNYKQWGQRQLPSADLPRPRPHPRPRPQHQQLLVFGECRLWTSARGAGQQTGSPAHSFTYEGTIPSTFSTQAVQEESWVLDSTERWGQVICL